MIKLAYTNVLYSDNSSSDDTHVVKLKNGTYCIIGHAHSNGELTDNTATLVKEAMNDNLNFVVLCCYPALVAQQYDLEVIGGWAGQTIFDIDDNFVYAREA
jgi:hypothetical protein